ncbi:hypothetical protein Salat_0571500 [Sesamum alatum]|uniref:Uncharacterized protein n=1 Tax=Sesamum alatum TaxID=300844 RepID=A0AAE2CTN7_9LAMI|nr:hypothetical protein Salat_0571500 [Sesamum alatum]
MSFGLPSLCVPPLDSSSPRVAINVHHQPFSAVDSLHFGAPSPSPPIALPPCSLVGDPSPSPLAGRASSSSMATPPPPIVDGFCVFSSPMVAPFAKADAPCSRAPPPTPTPVASSLPRPRSPLLPTPPSQVRLASPPSFSGIGSSSVAFDKGKAIAIHNSFQELARSPNVVLDDPPEVLDPRVPPMRPPLPVLIDHFFGWGS